MITGGEGGRILGQELAGLCKSTPATPDDALLLAALRAHYPDLDFRLTRSDDEWYRIGGIVDARGDRLARDISEWAERAYLECGRNYRTLLRYCRENGLMATRHLGRTLYLVVALGETAQDFLQVEIDRVQEVRDRLLVGADGAPADLEELIDPLEPVEVEPEPLGPVVYVYRRKTEAAVFMAELDRHHAGKHPAGRFMDDWNRSSAGRNRPFCHEFNLKLHRHRGRYGERKMDVGVMAVQPQVLPLMEHHSTKKGTALQAALAHFDRQAGFPFAWYFYMVAKRYVPPLLAESVHRDLDGDFAYLPHRDAAVLRDWIADPYFV